jgi:hypothetical protein
MKAIIKYYDEWEIPEYWRPFTSLPVLDLVIHGAPHMRMHRAVLKQYRDELTDLAIRRIGVKVDLPIDHPICLKVLFTNPSSPDMDHLLTALYTALDGKTFKGSRSILTDDCHIQKLFSVEKYYPDAPTKRDGLR